MQRKNTRERVQRFRTKQKEKMTKLSSFNENPDSPSPSVLSSSSRKSELGRKRIRRDRTKLYRENLKLKDELNYIKRRVEMYRKRVEHTQTKLEKLQDVQLTPKSLTARTVRECFREGNEVGKRKIARQLFMHNAVAAAIRKKYCTLASTQEKRNLKLAVFKALKKYRIVRSSLNNYLGIRRGFRQTAGLKEKLNLRKKNCRSFLWP